MSQARHYEWLLPYFWSVRSAPEWQRLRPSHRWARLVTRALIANDDFLLDLQTIERFSAEQEALETLERLWKTGQPFPRTVRVRA